MTCEIWQSCHPAAIAERILQLTAAALFGSIAALMVCRKTLIAYYPIFFAYAILATGQLLFCQPENVWGGKFELLVLCLKCSALLEATRIAMILENSRERLWRWFIVLWPFAGALAATGQIPSEQDPIMALARLRTQIHLGFGCLALFGIALCWCRSLQYAAWSHFRMRHFLVMAGLLAGHAALLANYRPGDGRRDWEAVERERGQTFGLPVASPPRVAYREHRAAYGERNDERWRSNYRVSLGGYLVTIMALGSWLILVWPDRGHSTKRNDLGARPGASSGKIKGQINGRTAPG